MADATNELANALAKAFTNIGHDSKIGVNVAYLATVIKYNKSEHTADIQPLANSSDGQVSAQALDVPVSKNCYYMDEWWDRVRGEFGTLDSSKHQTNFLKQMTPQNPKKPQMHKGATVIVVVLDRDYQNWNPGGGTFTPESSRLHDISDSIIIGTI